MGQQDASLIALLMQDVDSHFQQLVETHQHQLFRMMYRQIGNAQDAEDIVQETFLRAYFALRDYATQGFISNICVPGFTRSLLISTTIG